MTPKIFSLITTSILLLASSSWAQSYSIGNLTSQGAACPQGTASAALSPDGTGISFLFDRFQASFRPGALNGRVLCQIRIPINEMPKGYTLTASYLDYRGYSNMSQGTIAITGVLSGSYSRFKTRSAIFAPQSGPFTLRQNNPVASGPIGKCPAVHEIYLEVLVEINTRILDVDFALDSVDTGAEDLKLGLSLKPCR